MVDPDFLDELPRPPSSTRAEPGSPEKIGVMSRRLEAGYHLHHPDDAPLAGTDRGPMTPQEEAAIRLLLTLDE